MGRVAVTRTYLEMARPEELRSLKSADPTAVVEQAFDCPASFCRYLYVEVGRRYHWVDRLPWTDEQWKARFADPAVTLWLLRVKGAPAGYFELERHEDDAVELAYFGLLPEFLGRGFGKHLLSVAVETAWSFGPRRVWLHTCTLDDPAALPNYESRGFRRFKQEVYETDLA
jgi:GNAT superfamily N-acetyltransferase